MGMLTAQQLVEMEEVIYYKKLLSAEKQGGKKMSGLGRCVM